MPVQTLPVSIHFSNQPWLELLAQLPDCGFKQLETTAWLLPRVELSSHLRAALIQHHAVPERFALSPFILSADRLSHRADSPEWLRFQLDVAQQLRAHPVLMRHAQSGGQFWGLVTEYCELALACVSRAQGEVALKNYIDSVALAGPEAEVVLTIAEIYQDTLLSLLPKAPDSAAWSALTHLVWLDDGEPWVEHWLQRHAAHLQILRVDLRIQAQGAFQGGATVTTQWLEAQELEPLAQACAAQLVAWLREDAKREIGVAVVDRLLARRVRSLLEAANVLVDDRTGWRLSTTRAAGWLDCFMQAWLMRDWQALAGAFEPRWLPDLDCFKDARFLRKWLTWIDRDMQGADWSLLSGLGSMELRNGDIARVAADAVPWLPAFEGFSKALTDFGHHPRALSVWAQDVLALLKSLGVLELFTAEPAGRDVVVMLRWVARADLSYECLPFEWLSFWRDFAEQRRFRAQDVSSPVRFLPLQSFRLQRFSNALVLGCAQRHFAPTPPGLLPPSVAAELGLSGVWLKREQMLSALSEMAATSSHLVFAHARAVAGQAEVEVGWLRYLSLLRRTSETGIRPWALSAPVREREVSQQVIKPLRWKGAQAPEVLSVEAVSDLSGCSLKFSLARLLGLKDSQSHVLEDQRSALRGVWIHEVLHHLHDNLSEDQAAAWPVSAWHSAILGAVAKTWQKMTQARRQLLYEDRLEFERLVPELAATLHTRFRAGWRVLMQEHPVNKTLVFGESARAVKILGRLDRLERAPDGLAIVDVKTTQKATLKSRSKAWQHYPQLPLYAWMLGEACQALSYLCIKGDAAEYVPVPDEKTAETAPLSPEDMAGAVVTLLSEALVHFFENNEYFKPLPGKDCDYCQFAGVCRNRWVNKHEDAVL